MKQKLWIVPAGAALGLGCGGLVNTLGGGNWKTLSAPLLTLGEGLRRLSLSGFWGNLGAWGIVLLISALPLAALARALGRADFDGEGVELCGRTALACRMAAFCLFAAAAAGPPSGQGGIFQPL